MKTQTLLKLLQRSLAATSKRDRSLPQQHDRGFTIIELLIVIILVGVLSAIAAPGWLAFINNQRLRTSQSQIYGALQLAQSFAKRDKISWQASFRTQGNLVQWAVHPVSVDAISQAIVIPNMPVSTSPSSAPNVWYSLEDKIAIDTTSTAPTNLQSVSGTYIAIFNRQGCLVDNPAKECTDATVTGFTIPQRITLQHAQLGSASRCAVVTTLLGAMRTGDDANSCNLIP